MRQVPDHQLSLINLFCLKSNKTVVVLSCSITLSIRTETCPETSNLFNDVITCFVCDLADVMAADEHYLHVSNQVKNICSTCWNPSKDPGCLYVKKRCSINKCPLIYWLNRIPDYKWGNFAGAGLNILNDLTYIITHVYFSLRISSSSCDFFIFGALQSPVNQSVTNLSLCDWLISNGEELWPVNTIKYQVSCLRCDVVLQPRPVLWWCATFSHVSYSHSNLSKMFVCL